MNRELNQVIHILHQAYGRDISGLDETFLKKAVGKRMVITSSQTVNAYLELLRQDRLEGEILVQSLNINYSEFFRNPLTFAVLEQLVLPRLAEAKEKDILHEIRVWSAGCAAGQEAYSVAILLEELSAAYKHPVPFRIFATDVSEAALASARKGVYDPSTMKNVRLKHLQTFFSQASKDYAVDPRLRSQIDFSIYDLLDEHSVCPADSLYGDFDLIFCCNLLFYYRPEIRSRILNKICNALSPGGFFVTGEAEKDIMNAYGGLRAIAPPAAVFQKRGRL